MARKITVPDLEFAGTGVPRWFQRFGKQRTIEVVFSDLTDISGYTFTTQIEEVDTPVGVEPTDGTLAKAGGERRALFEISKTGNTAVFAIPEQLGTSTGNDGTEDATTAPAATPQPGLPTYYYIGIAIADTGVGAAKQEWEVVGQIALTYSPVEQGG